MSFNQDQRDLVNCLNRLKSRPLPELLNDPEFRRFNRKRNMFNDYKVTKLIEQAPYNPGAPIFKDNLGRIWKEEVIGSKYQTDKCSLNPYKILADEGQALRKLGKEKKGRFSRKFILPTTLPGYSSAAFEMVVHRNGQRIVSGEKMETFNFSRSIARSSFSGKTADHQLFESGLHYTFDIAPRLRFGHSDIECFQAKPVRIIDMSDLFENGDLDLKKLFKR